MRKLVFILIGVVALASCNSENRAIRNQEAVVVSTANFEKDVEGLVDKKIAMEGTVMHVCKHGGKKFFLGEERITVLTSGKIGSFDTALEGSDVYVEGVLREERVDEAYLVDWEGELEDNSEVQEKEVAHKDEPGHDLAEETEETDDPNTAARARIANYREQIKESGKGYISFYTVDVLEVTEK